MKKILLIVSIVLLSVNSIMAASIESKIIDFAKREYPNDSRMQNYVYKKQKAAYNYLRTVKDQEVMDIALREYPYDYAMQKYIYNKQLTAKRYMKTVEDIEVKKISTRAYPFDYSMQKYIYDKFAY